MQSHEPIFLLIEASPADARFIRETLRAGQQAYGNIPPFQLTHVTTLADSLEIMAGTPAALILVNLTLPDSQGAATFTRIFAAADGCPIIVLAGSEDQQLVRQVLQTGAQDYLIKGRLDDYTLNRAVFYALKNQQKTGALEANEQRFRALIEQHTDGILVIDPANLIRFANPTAKTIFGQHAPLAEGQPFHYPLPAGQITELEIADGDTTITYEIRTNLVQWSGEKCTLAVLRDITERKTTQEKLIAERNLLRTVINNLPDDVYVKDLDGRYITVNLATLQNLGANTLIDVINKTDADFCQPDVAQKLQAEDATILQTGQAVVNREELIAGQGPDAPPRWVLRTKLPLRNAEGQLTGLVGINRDITERRQAEEALKKEHVLLAQRVNERTRELQNANRQLTHAVRVKDEFLASMSHELRTPLNAILGMSEILMENVYGPLNKHQSDSLNIIQDSGRHLLALINDILDVSKIEANKLKLESNAITVEDICQTSIRFVQQAAAAKDISISESYPAQPVIIHADERRMKQILVNLLSNAVKFTPTGGKIGLAVQASPKDQQVTFTVWDTGIGIAPADVDKLFQPFVQLDSRLSRQYEGTGLGLALVRLLADLHHATVSVESEIGTGSRFVVTMPWQQTTAAPPAGQKPQVTPEETERVYNTNGISPLILLAEDNTANVEVMASYLSAKGFRVVTARDGAEAVTYAKDLAPNLILMDIHMPDVDGLEATRQIRADKTLYKTPIVAITALAMPGDRERCLAAGVDDYLTKPISLKQLTSVIEKLLHK